jgi:biopolymer transport protein ExbD
MARLKRKKKISGEIPTASLGDMVFLMLIFFLVNTSMNPAKGLGMTLPPQGEQVEIFKENMLNVFVNPNGDILVRGEVTPLNEVKNKVKLYREEYKKIKLAEDPNAKDPELIVSLLAHPESEYRVMIDVLDEIKLAGAQKISLATPEF